MPVHRILPSLVTCLTLSAVPGWAAPPVKTGAGTERQVERNLTRHSAQDRRPAWSPDGREIAFTSNRDGNEEIYTVSLND